MQTAFIFNQLGGPDMTQFWSRRVVEEVFSGLSPSTGYNGDEDQGLMGNLAVLVKLGLFQMNGGTEENPNYALSSPLFPKTVLYLSNGNKLQINADQVSANQYYIEKLKFKGKEHPALFLSHSDLLQGGILEYSMAKEPTK